MKKSKGIFYSVLGIAFILFNVIAFVIPTAKTPSFWIAYAFTAVAFVGQIGIWKFGFKESDTLKSKFLGIPIIYVGIVYLLISLVSFAVVMIFPIIAPWIVIIVYALIVGISAICIIGAEVTKDAIKDVEQKIQPKVFFIRELQADVEMLTEQEKDSDIKSALKNLSEKIRYSDPMSNENLSELEDNICSKVAELKNSEDKTVIISEIDLLLTERNKKAKILK